MRARLILAVLALVVPEAALGNDTSAQLTTGGLVFVKNEDISLTREDLYVSTSEIRVRYEFFNRGADDRDVLMAFPLPDIASSPFEEVSIPSLAGDEPFPFSTLFNGAPVRARAYQYAFAAGIDRSGYLGKLGLSLVPFAPSNRDALERMDAATLEEMQGLGLVVGEVYDDGTGMRTHYQPYWTLKTTYAWRAIFPAGQTVVVEHAYQPSVGGTTGVTFLGDNQEQRARYEERYCMDASFLGAVARTTTPDEPWGAPFFENWISYILETGANWAGPIGVLHITVDKGQPDNLVSFCGDGVTKTGPTTFEMTYRDIFPSGNLDVLLLQRVD